jgi:uncharacterized membrane protein YuzA (DUF378 family)
MAKHKPLCWVMSLLVIIGGINWGLVGIGGFAGTNLNLVNLLFGSMPQLEWIVYIVVGLAALLFASKYFTMKECGCMKE